MIKVKLLELSGGMTVEMEIKSYGNGDLKYRKINY